jgi:stage III sporulation protein AB
MLLFICLISSYLGILKAKTFECREENLKKINNSLNMLKSKIEFTHEPLGDIFKDISKVIYSDKDNIFINVNSRNNQFFESWCESVEKIDNSFTKEDKEIIKTFGKQLRKN